MDFHTLVDFPYLMGFSYPCVFSSTLWILCTPMDFPYLADFSHPPSCDNLVLPVEGTAARLAYLLDYRCLVGRNG